MVLHLTARQPGRGGPGHYGGRRARAHRDEEAWSAMLLDGLAAVYERGWQPMDVAHVLDRVLDRRDGPAVAVAVLFQARTARADQRAPLSWVTQLEALAERHPRAGERAAALHAEGLGDGELGLRLAMDGLDVDHAVAALGALPTFPMLCDPPSAWPERRRAPAGPAAAPGRTAEAPAADRKMLGRVRGLLAKAEATDFPDEAEVFTAKAQELITRYAIDTALLARHSPAAALGTDGRRVHLQAPYLKEKMQLLTEISEVNGVRAVWADTHAIATVVGLPDDLERVELLFTSLLVQATRAMTGADTGGAHPQGVAAFRRGFLMGYAVRIGQRLRTARDKATAEGAEAAGVDVGELVPVFSAREEAVQTAFDELFPTTVRARTRRVDAAGWHAGTSAADAAHLEVGARRLRG